jgi:formylglycine-generating enzyme required for sulfatase activity
MQTWGIPTPDETFVAVAANPNFKFGKGAKNTGAGEKSAIEAPYAIGVYEVRNREYKEFVDATGRKELPKGWVDGTYPAGTKNCPVVGVTLKDVEDYCAWLATKHEGWIFRLPTEAEFENAAAGPKKLLYPWGAKGDFAYSKGELTTNCQYNGAVVAAFADAEITVGGKTGKASDLAKLSARGVVAKDGWRDAKTKSGFTYSDAFAKNSANGGFLVPVNKYDAESPYGMIGAAGNAAEMTSTVVDGKNVVRGGSWYSSAEECATTWRGETVDPAKGDPRVGFRVVAVRTDAPAPNAPAAE